MQSLRNAIRNLNLQRTMSTYYAVAKGHQVGIYKTWAQCELQVKGFKGAKYRKFPTREEAEVFIKTATASAAECAQFSPKDIAVALGQRVGPPAQWKPEESSSARAPPEDKIQVKEFWPESDGDSFDENDEISESDLLAAIAEVEGISDETPSENATKNSRKRKTANEATGASSSKLLKHASKIWEPAGLKRVGAFEFQIDAEGFVIVYTDGSCLNNGQKNACAGFGVYFDDDHPLNAAKPVLGRVTNNVGEIQAAIYAIKVAKDLGIPKICISTDSQFLINAITSWISAWKRKGWRLKDGGPVKNVADFKELDELLCDDTLLVKWNYVKAHKGIKGNEMADKLAREGSNIYRQMNLK